MVVFNSIEFNLIVFYFIEKNAFGWGRSRPNWCGVSGGRDRLRLPVVG